MPLQFVTPVSDQYINIGDQQRKTMGNIELAKDFKDLIDWRDRLYEKHRNV
jgi:glutathione S-transferase